MGPHHDEIDGLLPGGICNHQVGDAESHDDIDFQVVQLRDIGCARGQERFHLGNPIHEFSRLRFIDEQIRVYEVKLTEAENRLKEFKVRNFGVSGVSNQDYFLRISTLGEEVSKLRVELNAAEQARNAYRRELESEDPRVLPRAHALGLTLLPFQG